MLNYDLSIIFKLWPICSINQTTWLCLNCQKAEIESLFKLFMLNVDSQEMYKGFDEIIIKEPNDEKNNLTSIKFKEPHSASGI